MLECFLRQKVDLECDGPFNLGSEGYNVTSNADKLRHICSKGGFLSHYFLKICFRYRRKCTRERCKTRMHSSRLRTVHCSSRLLGGVWMRGGGCLPTGAYLPRGLSACQGRCLPARGGVCPGGSAGRVSARWVYTSPRGQTDTCENITSPQLLLRMVTMI